MTFLASADWHLRQSRPRCRLDSDWMETQRKAIQFIFDKAQEYDCPIVIVGDLFDTSKVDESVTNMLWDESYGREKLKGIYVMPGNHELYGHNIENINQSSIYPFCSIPNSGKFSPLSLFLSDSAMAIQYSDDQLNQINEDSKKAEIIFIHQLTFPNKKAQGLAGGVTAGELFDLFPNAKFIFTGDNHTAFEAENKKGQRLINSGCLIRQSADEIDFKPRIVYVDIEKDIVESVEVPDNENMVTDEYIQKENEREGRINAFIDTLQSKESVSLDFIGNLRKALEGKGIEKGTREAVYKVAKQARVEI
jgi:DNA repair exonuclease SbcCD nuclease subunit